LIGECVVDGSEELSTVAAAEGVYMNGVHKMQFQTKQEWLYHTLRDAIRNCELEPGERLLMDELAAEFNVSRVPVREALLQLQAEGLVQMVPHSGAVVAPITFASAQDYFAISRELQVLAGRAAAERMTDSEREALRTLVDRMERLAEAGDREQYTKANLEFHQCLANVSRMPLVPHFLDQFQQHWQRVMCYYGLNPMPVSRMQETVLQHRAIVEALVAGDADAAERAIREHNVTGLEDHLRRMAEKRPDIQG